MALVEIRGLKRVQDLTRRLSESIQRLLEEVTKEVKNRAVEYAPERTGFLRSHTYYVVEPGLGRVISSAPYSAYVEYGTRPHTILPRRAQALRFEMGGRVIFARYVRHPGSRGRFFIRRAVEETLSKLQDIAKRVFR